MKAHLTEEAQIPPVGAAMTATKLDGCGSLGGSRASLAADDFPSTRISQPDGDLLDKKSKTRRRTVTPHFPALRYSPNTGDVLLQCMHISIYGARSVAL